MVAGGTAALDSVVERKFKKKSELIGKNLAVVKAAWDYAVEHEWDKVAKEATATA